MAQLFQNYTREQLKQFQERMQQAAEQLTEEQKQQLRERYAQASAAGQQQSAMLQQGTIQLREGLTVTVSIVLQQRTNVLMVPNKAIISRQGKTFVQVMKDGVTEERPVSIGLSGWQNTEIIEGLSEGEQVLLPQSTNTTSTQQQPAGFFGGMRR
jgi:excinuclease UvrABC nuclease subunit